MIPRRNRFHGYGSLRAVYQNGKTVRGSQISLRFQQRGANKTHRVAVVVSKKVHKSAVVRNRIRRRIYEIVRNYQGSPLTGFDLVITVFSDQIAETEAPKLEKSITELLDKAVGTVPKA